MSLSYSVARVKDIYSGLSKKLKSIENTIEVDEIVLILIFESGISYYNGSPSETACSNQKLIKGTLI